MEKFVISPFIKKNFRFSYGIYEIICYNNFTKNEIRVKYTTTLWKVGVYKGTPF